MADFTIENDLMQSFFQEEHLAFNQLPKLRVSWSNRIIEADTYFLNFTGFSSENIKSTCLSEIFAIKAYLDANYVYGILKNAQGQLIPFTAYFWQNNKKEVLYLLAKTGPDHKETLFNKIPEELNNLQPQDKSDEDHDWQKYLTETINFLGLEDDYSTALNHCLDNLEQYFHYNQVYLYKINNNTELEHHPQPSLSYYWSKDRETIKKDNFFLQPQQIPWLRSMFDQFVEYKQWYTNVNEEGMKDVPEVQENNIQSILAVPIISQKNIEGFIIYCFPHVHLNDQKQNKLVIWSTFLSMYLNTVHNEEMLSTHQSFISRIVDTSPSVLFVYDYTKKVYSYFSPHLKQLTGYNVNDFQNITSYEFKKIVHPDDLPRVLQTNKQVKHGHAQEVHEVEYRLKHTKGHWIWLLVRYIPFMRDYAGNVKQVVGTAQDITEKKQVEESLVASESFNRAIVESFQDALFILVPEDNTFRFTYANEAMFKLTGFKKNTFLNKNIEDIFPAEIIPRMKKRLNEAIKKSKTVKFDEVYNLPIGKKAFSLKIAPEENSNNQSIRLIGSAQDITREKETQDRIRRNQLMLQSINHNISEGIFRQESDGQLSYVNQACVKMFGFTSKREVYKFPFKNIYASEEEHNRLIQLLIKDGSFNNLEVEFEKVTGERFWGLMSCILIKEPNEGFYIDGAIRDITPIKQAEERLKNRNEELNKLNNELDNFVYSASHDLRAPLASLLGLVSLTENEETPENINHYLELMRKSIHRMDDFINDIVSYSRNSRLQIEYKPLQLKQFVQEIFESLSYLEQADKLKLYLDFDEEFTFYTDESRLKVILSNLIANSIHYSNPYKEHSYIKIAAFYEDNFIVLKVEDNGKGIGEAHMEKIFNMFYRATSSKSGSGLGLYIAQEAIKKLNGNIDVTSEVGEGTTFTIKLPQPAEEEVVEETKEEEKEDNNISEWEEG